MAYEVKYDDGGYCCHFSHGKKKYYADLRDTYDHGNECMIFREGTWNDLYCRRWIPVTKEQMISCIGAFIAKMDADQGRGSGHEKTCTVCRSVSV